MSKIEWTHKTWNCITGCSKQSTGCLHCYSERMSKRLQGIRAAKIERGEDPKGLEKYKHGFDRVVVHPECLDIPTGWKTGCRVFVNSMSDTLHKDVPSGFLAQMLAVMRNCPQHQFMILTKRHSRIQKLLDFPLTSNVWIGVSIENHNYKYRMNPLLINQYPRAFLSLEPLLGPVPSLNLDGIRWVIVGGESGPGARPMYSEWVRDIRDQCVSKGVPFFFKQWGGVRKKDTGRVLDRRTWEEYPEGLIL